jgi:hypothetical protein
LLCRHINWSLERQFDEADVALYNVREDPAEKVDLRFRLPHVFTALRQVLLATTTKNSFFRDIMRIGRFVRG